MSIRRRPFAPFSLYQMPDLGIDRVHGDDAERPRDWALLMVFGVVPIVLIAIIVYV